MISILLFYIAHKDATEFFVRASLQVLINVDNMAVLLLSLFMRIP
jgi:hypothetical protein